MKDLIIKFILATFLAVIALIGISYFINYLENKDSYEEVGSIEVKKAEKEKDVFLIRPKDNTSFFKDLPRYFAKIKGLKRIELIDQEEKQIDFFNYLNKSNYFPNYISSEIDSIDFYVYNKETGVLPSESIVIKLKEENVLDMKTMSIWEKTMYIDLKGFILIGEKYDLVEARKDKVFKDSHKFENTRYINFSQNGEVSLSYTLYDNYLILSNSYEIHNKIINMLIDKEMN